MFENLPPITVTTLWDTYYAPLHVIGNLPEKPDPDFPRSNGRIDAVNKSLAGDDCVIVYHEGNPIPLTIKQLKELLAIAD